MKYLVTYTVEVEAYSAMAAKCKAWDTMQYTNNFTADVQLVDEADNLAAELNEKQFDSAKLPNLSSYLDYRYED